MRNIIITRGGHWEKEDNQDVFHYKVKITNNSQFTIRNILIMLDSFPKAFNIDADKKKIEVIIPNSFEERRFKLKAKDLSIGGNLIKASCSFIDHLGNSQHMHVEPLKLEYTMNLLTPVKYRGTQKNIDVTNRELGIDYLRDFDDFNYTCGERESIKSQVSEVYFSVYAPTSITPDSSFILNVWAYLLEQKSLMEEIAVQKNQYEKRAQKGPIQASLGDEFNVCLELPKPFIVEECLDLITWFGKITNATFAVSVPKKTKLKTYLGRIMVFFNGIQLLRIDFTLKVGKYEDKVKDLTQNVDKIQKYFASYSSEDREEVLKRIHGIKSIPGVDVFLDCLSMHQGEYWESKIHRNILNSDLLLLFWSTSASKSEWVKMEWKFALKKKGLDFIQPIPLTDPKNAPPPKELKSKHFNDMCLIALRSK